MSSSVYNWSDDEAGRGAPRQHTQGGVGPSSPGPQQARAGGGQAPVQPTGPRGPGRGARAASAAGAAAGGFVGGLGGSLVPPVTVNIGSGSDQNGNGGGPGGKSGGGKVPGSDFMNNEDIRAYCEYYRKKARNLATEMAMDADYLESVLRTIPDPAGALGGSRARARRVTRWLKKASAAQKAQQKYFASLYGTFEREFESNLRTIKARHQEKPARTFGWR